jgi:tetratricopeptide (TPR) repeat protein
LRLLLLLAILRVLPAAAQTSWERDLADGKAMLVERRLAEAEPFFKQALVKAQEFGPEDPRLATSLKDLAGLYRLQGRFAEAEPLLRLAIDLAGKDGREHPETATDLDLLARICLAQMKLPDAENTFKRELALLVDRHGAGALEIVPVLNSLGRVIQIVSKRVPEAQDLLLRVVGIRESRQGPEHPDLALDLIRLGRLLATSKVFDDAELAYRRALAIQEKAVGPEHLTLAIVLDSLGSLFSDQKRWTDAEWFFRRSLGLRESAYSPLNFEVVQSLDNLANVLYQQKRYGEAEPLYERGLFIRTAALGAQHPLVAEAHDALAITQAFQQKYEAAEKHYRAGLEIREGHILVSLNNTALARSALEKRKEAEPLYKVALAILERPREGTPDLATYALTLSNYASLLEEMGRKPEAVKIEARAKLLKKDEDAKKAE